MSSSNNFILSVIFSPMLFLIPAVLVLNSSQLLMVRFPDDTERSFAVSLFHNIISLKLPCHISLLGLIADSHQQIIYLCLILSIWSEGSLIQSHLKSKYLLIFHGYGLYVLNSENVIGRNAIFPESKSSDVRFRKDDIFSIFFVKRIAFSIGSDDKLHLFHFD